MEGTFPDFNLKHGGSRHISARSFTCFGARCRETATLTESAVSSSGPGRRRVPGNYLAASVESNTKQIFITMTHRWHIRFVFCLSESVGRNLRKAEHPLLN
jgi:hypothetical protein